MASAHDIGARSKVSQKKAARKQNPHAQAYFLEHRKLPKTTPGSYSPGSQEEAIIAWDILRIAWKKHLDAQSWLKSQK